MTVDQQEPHCRVADKGKTTARSCKVSLVFPPRDLEGCKLREMGLSWGIPVWSQFTEGRTGKRRGRNAASVHEILTND